MKEYYFSLACHSGRVLECQGEAITTLDDEVGAEEMAIALSKNPKYSPVIIHECEGQVLLRISSYAAGKLTAVEVKANLATAGFTRLDLVLVLAILSIGLLFIMHVTAKVVFGLIAGMVVGFPIAYLWMHLKNKPKN